MLRCRDGSLYTGAARDLAVRFRQHEAGKASRYTRARRPLRLVWSRRVRTWGHALRTEYRLKQLSRAEKERLAAGAAWRIGGRPAARVSGAAIPEASASARVRPGKCRAREVHSPPLLSEESS
jgi:putative endonuclease